MTPPDPSESEPPSVASRAAGSPSDRAGLNLAAIYHEYFDFVWRCGRRLGVDEGSIDDVVQEVFIVIHARLHTLEKPETLRSWIYSILRRIVSTFHRARRTRERGGARLFFERDCVRVQPPTPHELAVQSDEAKLLWSILEEIDDDKREVFVLSEMDELTVPEIAEALSINVNTAYSRLRAAKLLFEKALSRRKTKVGSEGTLCRT